MNDYFTWKGKKSTEFGMHVEKMPDVIIPQERLTFQTVPGRSGTIATRTGEAAYEDFTLPIECFIEDYSRIADIAVWLKGRGNLVVPSRPNGYYDAYPVNQINFKRVMSQYPYCTVALNFRCQPFFYPMGVGYENVVIPYSGYTLKNPCTYYAEPRITLVLDDHALFWVGDMSFAVTVDALSVVTIDSYMQEVTCTSGDCQFTGNYPLLPAGDAVIRWESNAPTTLYSTKTPVTEGIPFMSGPVLSVQIEPRWRSL